MTLLHTAREWVLSNELVVAAVIFGSLAKNELTSVSNADVDLHLVVRNPKSLIDTDWQSALPREEFCCDVVRPATGGVTKITAVFMSGQLDIVVVPELDLIKAKDSFYQTGLTKGDWLSDALNEMATCLHGGYIFLKGESLWSNFYRDIEKLPGVRLSDKEIHMLSNGLLIDALWICQKITGGEIVAAQYVLHSRISNTCLRLHREARLRAGFPLRSFGLGRHIEATEEPTIASELTVFARPIGNELIDACENAIHSMQRLTTSMLPGWTPNERMAALLSEFGVRLCPTER